MKDSLFILAIVGTAFAAAQVALADAWTELDSTFTCNATLGTYNWPYPDSCTKYYQCVDGSEPTVKTCWFLWLRKFNRNWLSCDWTWKVDCNDVPVPEPPV